MRKISTETASIIDRRGNVLLATVIMLPALFGIVSLGVDYGRVQLAKSELQAAADAATRAAAMQLDVSYAAVVNAAKASAAENRVAGQSVVLADSDIVIGIYEPVDEQDPDGEWVFTAVTAINFSEANAVRIVAKLAGNSGIKTSFVSMLGISSINVSAVSSSMRQVKGTNQFGAAGTNSVSVTGSGQVHSYYSSQGGPSSKMGNLFSTASVVSNGLVSVASNKGKIAGDVYHRTIQPTGIITGAKIVMGSDIAYATSTLPGSYISLGTVSLDNTTQTLTSGNYFVNSLSLTNKAKLKINATNGPVKLYVNGPISLTDKAQIQASRPGLVEVHVLNNSTVMISNKAKFRGQLYAPQSTATIDNGSMAYGSIVSSALTIGDKSRLFVDRSLDSLGSQYETEAAATVVMIE